MTCEAEKVVAEIAHYAISEDDVFIPWWLGLDGERKVTVACLEELDADINLLLTSSFYRNAARVILERSAALA
jgi:hypothetical protein